MLSSLNISTLQQHRKSSRLTLFCQIIYNTLPISIPSYYQRTHSYTRVTRQYHQNHFILPQATLNTYKYSFYPRTIKEWKNLPINVIESRDINKFTYVLTLPYFLLLLVTYCMRDCIYHLRLFTPWAKPAELTA